MNDRRLGLRLVQYLFVFSLRVTIISLDEKSVSTLGLKRGLLNSDSIGVL